MCNAMPSVEKVHALCLLHASRQRSAAQLAQSVSAQRPASCNTISGQGVVQMVGNRAYLVKDVLALAPAVLNLHNAKLILSAASAATCAWRGQDGITPASKLKGLRGGPGTSRQNKQQKPVTAGTRRTLEPHESGVLVPRLWQPGEVVGGCRQACNKQAPASAGVGGGFMVQGPQQPAAH